MMQVIEYVFEFVGDELMVYVLLVVDQWVYFVVGGDQQDVVIQLFCDDVVDVVEWCVEKCEGKVLMMMVI